MIPVIYSQWCTPKTVVEKSHLRKVCSCKKKKKSSIVIKFSLIRKRSLLGSLYGHPVQPVDFAILVL